MEINYKEKYDSLIKYYQEHPISKKDGYCEKHHIVPASCDGSNSKDNLINLPADIHYKVHCYLPFIYLEQGKMEEYHKMIYAWKRLLNTIDERKILYNIDENAIEYKKLREEHSKIVSYQQTGKNNNIFGAHWYKDPNDKSKTKQIKEGDFIPEGWVRGRWAILSNASRNKLGNTSRNRTGYTHITNGIINKILLKGENIPDGFYKGVSQKTETKKKFEKIKIEKILLLKEQFIYLQTHNWEEFIVKFNYKYKYSSFLNTCRRHLGIKSIKDNIK